MANHRIEIDLIVDDDDLDGVANKLKKVEKNVKGAMDGSKASVNQMNNSVSRLDKFFQGVNSTASKFGLTSVKTFTQQANAWGRMSQFTLKWADHVNLAQRYVKELGVETNSLKGKVMTLGLAFSSKLAASIEKVKLKLAPVSNAFNPIISKVNTFAKNLKTRVGSAIDSVKSKLGSFKVGTNGSFNTLGNGADKANKSIGLLGATISNFAGMFLYDFAMGILQAGKASITASSQIDYFAGRLKQMESDVGKFNVGGFKKDLGELQKEFRKVDMTAVGASAEELAVKLKLPADSDSMKNLSETIAVTSSAFVKEGRTQEDAILAVSDALDGQFMKLKELGIGQEELKKNGWSGDLNDKKTLIEGLNKTLEELGFTQTAKDITTLDDAMGALTIAGGQLLQKVLVPLTPILIGVVEAFIGVTDGVGSFINALSNLPDSAKIAGIGAALVIVAGIIWSVVIPAIAGGLMNAMVSLGSMVGITIVPELATLSTAFFTLAGAIWASVAPLLPFIVAGALLAVAIYEIGKAFGWWSDIGSMLDAIKAGISRLWSAFINNPNVKATIEDIKGAINGLWSFLSSVGKQIGDAWNSLFPKGKGEFDIVRAIIDFFGELGNACGKVINALKGLYSAFNSVGGIINIIANPIGTIVSILRTVICALLGCSPGIVPALQRVQEVFSSAFSFIAGFIGSVIGTIVSIIMTIVTAVQNVINIFSLFLSGQISVTDMVVMLWQNFSAMFTSILNILVGFVSGWGGRILQIIVSTVQGWINNAVNGARNLVNNVHNALSALPGKVSSALSGLASKFTQPFKDAWGMISPYIEKVKSGISTVSGLIHSIPSFGFEGASFGFTGESYGWEGIDNLDTLNSTLTTTGNDLANRNSITNNFNINGIIEEEASEYIVGAVNDHIRKQNLIRGV